MKDVLTGFKAPVTSLDVNRIKALVTPPGRYFGFDSLITNSNSSETHIPLSVSHQDVLRYLDDSNQEVQAGVAMTRHGLSYYTDEDIPVLVPFNTSPSQYLHTILVMDFTWINSETYALPTFYVIPGKHCDTATESFNLTPYLYSDTQVALAKIVVEPSGVFYTDCSIQAIAKPDFLGLLPDETHLAKLNSNNNFTGANYHQALEAGESSFIASGGSNTWSLPTANVVEVVVPDTELAVSVIQGHSLSGAYKETLVLLKDIDKLTLVTGGNIAIEQPMEFVKGDVFTIAKTLNGYWRVTNAFDWLKLLMSDFSEIRDHILLGNSHNFMSKGLGLASSSCSVFSNTLRIKDTVNNTIHLSQDQTFNNIMVYENGVEVTPEVGSVIILNVVPASANPYVLKVQTRSTSDKPTFIINGSVELGEVVELGFGVYILQKTSTYQAPNGWSIMAAEGSMKISEQVLIPAGSSLGTHGSVLSFKAIVKPGVHLQLVGSVVFSSEDSSTISPITIPTTRLDGAIFFLHAVESWRDDFIKGVVEGTTLNLTGDGGDNIVHSGTYSVNIILPLAS